MLVGITAFKKNEPSYVSEGKMKPRTIAVVTEVFIAMSLATHRGSAAAQCGKALPFRKRL